MVEGTKPHTRAAASQTLEEEAPSSAGADVGGPREAVGGGGASQSLLSLLADTGCKKTNPRNTCKRGAMATVITDHFQNPDRGDKQVHCKRQGTT